ncbi:MAG TPA: Asp-tRNA(Asn)/Glu-tRNA(Gln) amidotransferase GatCAB subunit B [Lentisphaeria bacterium]|nr:Asp-tRNA(Asn)/Glu-tRNA(Gln) amidotransferase GatCAB subunit B [Lentisphaeria bacterium]
MDYRVVIGLEIHVQLRTKSKMFCSCPNRMLAEPNTLICPVCMGYPGVLPTPNQEAIRKTVLAGLMINCDIPEYSKFDRKSYFYPDMPKNYQLTQYDLPLCVGGSVLAQGRGLTMEEVPEKLVQINRIHLEEDVAKSTHGGAISGIDYNRAGVPLMEIVTEPDITGPNEAYAFLNALKQAMQYAEISDCDMEKGQMRCDVNISVMPVGQEEFNPKTELKNLNSFKNVFHAIEYETERQIDDLEEGRPAIQATRGWDAERGESTLQRIKEDAHDYRYFPEPDLMPIVISAERLAEIRACMPETPAARRDRFSSEYGLPPYDAGVLTAERDCADYFETCVKLGATPKKASNWIMVELMRELGRANLAIAESPVSATQLAALLGLIDSGKINGKIAKTVFAKMIETSKDPAAIVEEEDLVGDNNEASIRDFAQQAIDANPVPVEDYRSGNAKAINSLVGQVMKLSRGKANPQLAIKALKGLMD